MHLLAQPTLGADAERIAHDEHPDHQFGIDRWAPRLAIIRPQMLANAAKVNGPVNRAQQVILRHMALEAEAVKQRLLHHCLLAHHRLVSCFGTSTESEGHDNFNRKFLTASVESGHKRNG